MVSHELPTLFGICDDGIFLDAVTRTAIAHGSPSTLRDSGEDPAVDAFMNRQRLAGENPRRGNGPWATSPGGTSKETISENH
jgi:phospholipid/cholesterol/gamma-HCH transport system ATP-binding protein